MARSIGRSAKEWKSQLDTDDQNMAKGISKLGGARVYMAPDMEARSTTRTLPQANTTEMQVTWWITYSQHAAKGISKLGGQDMAPHTGHG